MHKILLIANILILIMSTAVLCAAQVTHAPEKQTPEKDRSASNAHSFTEMFSKLEADFSRAVQDKDEGGVEAMLAPEFMLRTSRDPENPLPRTESIQYVLASCQLRSFTQRAFAIRAFIGVAVVSFVESRQGTIGGKDCSGNYLVVDLWEANHGKWQISDRYSARVGELMARRNGGS